MNHALKIYGCKYIAILISALSLLGGCIMFFVLKNLLSDPMGFYILYHKKLVNCGNNFQ